MQRVQQRGAHRARRETLERVRCVYRRLARYSEHGCTVAGVEAVAAFADCSPRSVKRARAELERRGELACYVWRRRTMRRARAREDLFVTFVASRARTVLGRQLARYGGLCAELRSAVLGVDEGLALPAAWLLRVNRRSNHMPDRNAAAQKQSSPSTCSTVESSNSHKSEGVISSTRRLPSGAVWPQVLPREILLHSQLPEGVLDRGGAGGEEPGGAFARQVLGDARAAGAEVSAEILLAVWRQARQAVPVRNGTYIPRDPAEPAASLKSGTFALPGVSQDVTRRAPLSDAAAPLERAVATALRGHSSAVSTEQAGARSGAAGRRATPERPSSRHLPRLAAAATAMGVLGRLVSGLRGGGRAVVARVLRAAAVAGGAPLRLAVDWTRRAANACNPPGAVVAAALAHRKAEECGGARAGSPLRSNEPLALRRARAVVALAECGQLGPRAAALAAGRS